MAPGGVDEDADGACDEAAGLIPAFFWGICDLKYDPQAPEGERVKVLELGDGRNSRFSGHGFATREKFRHEYCLASSYLKLDVLVENKQLTHDRFVREGFPKLRPRAACYPRQYSQGLATRIISDLRIQDEEAVVLKLCNRNRGAGVVVAPVKGLDGLLHELLEPPSGAALDLLLQKGAETAIQQEPSGDFEEQCLHWWSNEYPCFIAEACCHSLAIPTQSGGGGPKFDGTMRVAFALLPRKKEAEAEPDNGTKYEVAWLGGYWKLPKSAADDKGHQDNPLESLRSRIVSSFTGEKRTAEVEDSHLQEVYAALSPALPKVLRIAGTLDVPGLTADYKSAPAVLAFLLARTGATMWRTKMRSARNFFQMAMDQILRGTKGRKAGPPEQAVLSYIERNLAVCSIMDIQLLLPASAKERSMRSEALSHLSSSLNWLPTNATALFVQGRCLMENSNFEAAAESFQKALALDPDFKSSYLGLANCQLQLGEHLPALRASRACLRRHVDSPTALFNLGQACYHLVRGGLSGEEEGGREELCKTGARALEAAKNQDPKCWRPPDDLMLAFLSEPHSTAPIVPVRTRKVFGWRP